jgi:hypothetical protein
VMDLSLKLAIKTIELNLGWIIHLGNCEGCDGSEANLSSAFMDSGSIGGREL